MGAPGPRSESPAFTVVPIISHDEFGFDQTYNSCVHEEAAVV